MRTSVSSIFTPAEDDLSNDVHSVDWLVCTINNLIFTTVSKDLRFEPVLLGSHPLRLTLKRNKLSSQAIWE